MDIEQNFLARVRTPRYASAVSRESPGKERRRRRRRVKVLRAALTQATDGLKINLKAVWQGLTYTHTDSPPYQTMPYGEAQ